MCLSFFQFSLLLFTPPLSLVVAVASSVSTLSWWWKECGQVWNINSASREFVIKGARNSYVSSCSSLVVLTVWASCTCSKDGVVMVAVFGVVVNNDYCSHRFAYLYILIVRISVLV